MAEPYTHTQARSVSKSRCWVLLLFCFWGGGVWFCLVLGFGVVGFFFFFLFVCFGFFWLLYCLFVFPGATHKQIYTPTWHSFGLGCLGRYV